MEATGLLTIAVSFGTVFGLISYYLARFLLERWKRTMDELSPSSGRLCYTMAPLMGLLLMFAIYYGSHPVALTVGVCVVIAILWALMAFIVLYLLLALLFTHPCMAGADMPHLNTMLAIVLAGLSGVGIFFAIQASTPTRPNEMPLPQAGASVLAGLIVFFGVLVIAHTIDSYFQHRKKVSDTRMAEETITELDAQTLENEGKIVSALDYSRNSSRHRPLEEGEKRFTVTIEDSASETVYNFHFRIAEDAVNDANCFFELLSSYILRKALEYNPDIQLKTLKRSDGTEIVQEEESEKFNVWDSFGKENDLLVIAETNGPPALT